MISLLHIFEFILIFIALMFSFPMLGSIMPPINRSDFPSRKEFLIYISIIIFTFTYIFALNNYINHLNSNQQKIGIQTLPASIKINAKDYWLVQSKMTSNEINVVLRAAPFPVGRGHMFETNLLEESKIICDRSFRICPDLEKITITWKSRITNRKIMILVFERALYEKIDWTEYDYKALPTTADYFWQDPNINSPII